MNTEMIKKVALRINATAKKLEEAQKNSFEMKIEEYSKKLKGETILLNKLIGHETSEKNIEEQSV